MGARPAHPVQRFICGITSQGADENASDEDLLARFATHRNESAFATLVRRHAPMVLGVCIRTLGDTPDAEDAFQATFIVLAHRASSVSRPELLANWLYGVAYRTSLKAKSRAARRRAMEREVSTVAESDSLNELAQQDLKPVLDYELSRLPEKYRVPIVLCYLEGQTHEEAALRLGCPRKTVTTRLARGCERLHAALTRRGVTLSAAALVLILSESARAMSPRLLETTVHAVTTGTVPIGLASLAKEVLVSMCVTKVKQFVILLAVSALAIVLGASVLAGEPARAKKVAPAASTMPALADAASRQDTRDAKGQPDVKAAIPDTFVTALPSASARDDEPTVEKALPVVVKTVPVAGSSEVDPKLTEIKVTYSKDMMDASWSWAQLSDASFPKVDGKIRYEKDMRTCVLPVKLEPDKTYAIWLNVADKFENFKDKDGQPAVPYLLVFKTKK
jgi:RNA polymerase sigma-70 factor (ECF subfamily)